VRVATTDYVHGYNHQRLHGKLDYRTPEEYEQASYAALPDPPPGESSHRKTA
jgi:transposase InsO family protein